MVNISRETGRKRISIKTRRKNYKTNESGERQGSGFFVMILFKH